jgi:hypothetical protein
MYGILRARQQLTDAGFVNVETRIVKIPIGPWAKDKTLRTVGQYCRFSLEDGLEALSLGVMTRGALCLFSTLLSAPSSSTNV